MDTGHTPASIAAAGRILTRQMSRQTETVPGAFLVIEILCAVQDDPKVTRSQAQPGLRRRE